MTEVKPFIKCIDYWPVRLTTDIEAAYAEMIEAGQIRKHTVVFNKTAGSTTIEYYSTIPHEWIREELRNIVRKRIEAQMESEKAR